MTSGSGGREREDDGRFFRMAPGTVTVVTAIFDGRAETFAGLQAVLRTSARLEVWTGSAEAAAYIWARRGHEDTAVHRSSGATSCSKAALLRRAVLENRFGSTSFLYFDVVGFGSDEEADSLDFRWPDAGKLAALCAEDRVFLVTEADPGEAYFAAALLDADADADAASSSCSASSSSSVTFGGSAGAVVRFADRADGPAALLRQGRGRGVLPLAAACADLALVSVAPDDRRHVARQLLGSATAFLPRRYPAAAGLVVASYNDAGVEDDDLAQFLWSGAVFGYDVKLLGRSSAAVPAPQRWRRRTAAYLAFLRAAALDAACVLLCDATDVLFVASAAEFLVAFASLRSPCVVGAEPHVSYMERPTSKRTEAQCHHLLRGCGRPACFPNGGLLAGKPGDLIRLLEANAGKDDDQAGLYDLVLDGAAPELRLDVDSRLFGNAPWQVWPRDGFEDVWALDGRVRHKATGHRPCVMHFPGHGAKSRTQTACLRELYEGPRESFRPRAPPRLFEAKSPKRPRWPHAAAACVALLFLLAAAQALLA